MVSKPNFVGGLKRFAPTPFSAVSHLALLASKASSQGKGVSEEK